MKKPHERANRLTMRRLMEAYTRTLRRSHIASRSPCSSDGYERSRQKTFPLPNHNAPVQTEPSARPIIGLAGLLGVVELAKRLGNSQNAERQERAACLKEQFPP